MKTHGEIVDLLYNELFQSFDIGNKLSSNYNDFLGKSSIYISAIIENHLIESGSWDEKKWIDDCLIINLKNDEEKIIIEGYAIYGMSNTDQEWVEPFHLIIKKSNVEYGLFFKFKDMKAVDYNEYSKKRYLYNGYLSTYNEWEYIFTYINS